MALFTLSVSAHVERRSILALIVISFGTVEKRTDKTISRCFTIVTDASFHPISCGMATSRNRPRRWKHCRGQRPSRGAPFENHDNFLASV